eukprot:1141061-Pelagomonas_calceolata.AAC.10
MHALCTNSHTTSQDLYTCRQAHLDDGCNLPALAHACAVTKKEAGTLSCSGEGGFACLTRLEMSSQLKQTVGIFNSLDNALGCDLEPCCAASLRGTPLT